MGHMKTKVIRVFPRRETFSKIDALKQQLHTSRAGFCNLALDFFLPLLESGKAKVANGQVKIVKTSPILKQ